LSYICQLLYPCWRAMRKEKRRYRHSEETLNCSVENIIDCHFERAKGEPRNLLFNRFLHFTMLRIASVEMTYGFLQSNVKCLIVGCA